LTITRSRSSATRSPQVRRAGRAAPAAPRPATSLAPAPPAAAVLRLQRAYGTPVGGGAPGNLAREDFYIDASIDALQAGDTDKALNKLGDAAHVSADRGSHGEGDRGRGHDAPHPPPGQNGTQMPNFMEKFDDCDNQGLNPNGYAYGVARTSEMLGRFLGKAQNLEQGDQDLDADAQESGDIELDEF
jgi:hypothetical protein